MIRATFSGFSTAFSALQASQKRLDIVGQNLSNMNTQGYTRQQLETSSLNYSNPISRYMNGSQIAVGFGVSMDKVSQIRDPYLDAQYRAQINKSGYSDTLQSALDTLSKALDESSIDGIRTAFDDVQSTLTNLQDKGNDSVYESELRSRMQSLTNLLNDAARQIEAAEKAELSKLDGTGTSEQGAVDKVNDILRQIGNLNHQIKQNQVLGQQSLELLDERNSLLDELASYIPIEVTYFKDAEHDGKMKVPGSTDIVDAPKELYNYDSKGNIISRKEWPDDLKVELVYRDTTDPEGTTQRLTLINGTEGTLGSNYGKLTPVDSNPADPTAVSIQFTPASSSGETSKKASATGIQLASGSIQASLDMLGKKGTGDPVATGSSVQDDVRGYQYYMKRLDELASHFAKIMNDANAEGGQGKLLTNRTDPAADITALTIGISKEWINGTVQLGKKDGSSKDTVLSMLNNMKKAHTELDNKSFADYMNNISTILANDSSSNINALKTNVTVLNSIQDSRDSISGVSLDEEASNMMTYLSAYNAASRLMTALDEALNTLISGTGLVGR
ncbi:flagellar basal body protein [Enterocloster bolteae]|mgnify:FL=1|uniref:flagellar hook-associated protein FlgK n=1 Tax=Enterocloster bolteae TaxID=208479 RepID=UPI001D06F9C9|nr:flagellar basal body protein [Enterocloster bolteae]MCB6926463.1 flagellar basal body protein [Enterocloster bolteae]MCQ4755590.1 flagellar basal body protein [Enterocloster bolteae]